MTVFNHLLYEYKKGLRDLALHTCHASYREKIESKLNQMEIDYIVQQVTPEKINVFFGDHHCVDIIRLLGNKRLYEYTDEEDFILGVMLGYNRLEQCKRYMRNKKQSIEKTLHKGIPNKSLMFNSLN